MSDSLRHLLPAFVANLAGIGQLLDALGAEAARLEKAADGNCRQMAATTADRRLDLWEKELGLLSRPDLDTESRRALVLAALSFFGPCTPEGLKLLFARMTGGQAEYSEAPEAYTLYLTTYTPGRLVTNLVGAAQAVSRAAPAHIYCHLSAQGEVDSVPVCRHALHGGVVLTLYSK